MCHIVEFPIWDQARTKPSDCRVTHIFGIDYLLPADLVIEPDVRLDRSRVWIVSDNEIQAELVATARFVGTEMDPIEVAIPVLLKTSCSIGNRFFDSDRSGYLEQVVIRLAGLKTWRHRSDLKKCLSVAVRRRQLRQNRLRRSVPEVIRVY